MLDKRSWQRNRPACKEFRIPAERYRYAERCALNRSFSVRYRPWSKHHASELADTLLLRPVTVAVSNSLHHEFAREIADFHRQQQALLSGHGVMNPALHCFNLGTCVAKRHTQ